MSTDPRDNTCDQNGVHVNVEIKARCADPNATRKAIRELGARYEGADRQVDTYFRVPHGRLKLRQGNIETALIQYARPDQAGPRRADVKLYHPADASALKQALAAALGMLVVVAKQRDIFWLGNVKFHVDQVAGLGGFVEIEAIDSTGAIGPDHLLEQCKQFIEALGIKPGDLVDRSYSDLLLDRRAP